MSDTQITWSINNLERNLSDGYVFVAYWTVKARFIGAISDGSTAYGSVSLSRPDNLIPFEDLDEETVVGWVKDALGSDRVSELEDSVVRSLQEKAQPTNSFGVPWGEPESEGAEV